MSRPRIEPVTSRSPEQTLYRAIGAGGSIKATSLYKLYTSESHTALKNYVFQDFPVCPIFGVFPRTVITAINHWEYPPQVFPAAVFRRTWTDAEELLKEKSFFSYSPLCSCLNL